MEFAWRKICDVGQIDKLLRIKPGNKTWIIQFHKHFYEFQYSLHTVLFIRLNSSHSMNCSRLQKRLCSIQRAQTGPFIAFVSNASPTSAGSKSYVTKWRMNGYRIKLMSFMAHYFAISRDKKEGFFPTCILNKICISGKQKKIWHIIKI